ncbi:hypothetical protein Hanom_Chr03g00272751 [Helianthus anomalus]
MFHQMISGGVKTMFTMRVVAYLEDLYLLYKICLKHQRQEDYESNHQLFSIKTFNNNLTLC